MNRMITIFILIALYCNSAWASPFYSKREHGWYWFEKPEFKKKKDPNHELAQIKNDPKLSASQKVEKIVKLSALKRDEMLLNPTLENVINFRMLQKEFVNISSQVSDHYQLSTALVPALDMNATHPASATAVHIRHLNDYKNKEQYAHELAKSHGLFFFYKAGCKYCQEYAGFVKQFAQKYNFEVIPVSLDNESLPEFPQSRFDSGIAKKFGVSAVPTLIAVNSKSTIPLARGYTSEEEILNRLKLLNKGATK